MRQIERQRASRDKEHRWLLGAGSDLQPTASKETGNSASRPRESGFRHHPRSPEKDQPFTGRPRPSESPAGLDTSTAAR